MANFPSSYIFKSFVFAKISNLKSNCVCLVIPVLLSQYSLSHQQQFRYSKNKMVINLCPIPLCPKVLGIKQRYSAFTEARFKPQNFSELHVCCSNNDNLKLGPRVKCSQKEVTSVTFTPASPFFLHHHCSITEHSCLISRVLRGHSSTLAGATS